MPLYPREIIEEVRSGNDIVDVVSSYVALRRQGSSYFGLCPFHNEKSPSFSVSDDKQIFYCFGCGAGGNVISFVMQIENYDFLEAFKWLAERIHYPLPQPEQSQYLQNQARSKELLADIHVKAARFFYDALQSQSPDAKAAVAYLDRRGVHPQTRVKYGLGLSPTQWDGLYKYLTGSGFSRQSVLDAGLALPNNRGDPANCYDRFRKRLIFPIIDIGGKVIGFGGRILGEGEPKYLNSPDTPLFDKSRHLYGLHLARKAKSKEIILVEGYMDVISLHQAGFPQVAGILGTALSVEHTRLLKRINCESVVLLLDSDEAGTRAALKAIPVLLSGGLKVKVLQVTDAKDPDEFLQRYGSARFAKLLENAQSHIAFRVGLLHKRYALDKTDQRVAFTQETAALLSTLDSAIEADAYISEVSALTGISPVAIRDEMLKQRKTSAEAPQRDRPALRYRMQGSPAAEKGLKEARKELLGLLLAHPSANRAVQAHLTPAEMDDPVCAELLSIAYEYGQAGRLPVLADIIGRFETLEEQRQAAELLRDTPSYTDLADREKALNETLLLIKRMWLEKQMAPEDLNVVKTLFEAKRNLTKLYITMTDG